MSIRLTKPWIALGTIDIETLPAQLGVFQLADDDDRVIYIGYGGGKTTFGLRTAITEAIDVAADHESGPAAAVRYEVTHGYLSRWEELLMVHVHDAGDTPPVNDPLDAPRGRLSPIRGVAAESGP